MRLPGEEGILETPEEYKGGLGNRACRGWEGIAWPKTSLRQRHLSKDLKEAGERAMWTPWRNIPVKKKKKSSAKALRRE